jgi:glycosyltransferase involved in cell wall biosynthesis
VLDNVQIAIVVPAYNEAPHIERTLRGIPPYVDRIVVVDDASDDATGELAAASGDNRVRLLRHGRNRGVGAALKTGYQAAFESGADVVVVMAGDGQMDPADLHELLAPVLRGDADYAKGDRLSHPLARAHMPLTRYVGNHLLSAMTRLSTGLPIRDSQCGYTALHRRALDRLVLATLWDGYGYPNDLLGALRVSGGRVRDVVVRPVYGSEVSGIGLRHALFVIPFLLLRVVLRRIEAALTRVPSLADTPSAESE